MATPRSVMTFLPRSARAALAGATAASVWLTGLAWAGEGRAAESSEIRRGRQLFLTEWLPNDPRSHGGDGLGPVYNDTSCVACHNLGGPGGAGGDEKNAVLLTAFSNEELGRGGIRDFELAFLFFRAMTGKFHKKTPPPPSDRGALFKLHPGFRTARSLVLQKSATNQDYEPWRDSLLQEVSLVPEKLPPRERAKMRATFGLSHAGNQVPIQRAGFELTVSQRNPSPLFGAGLIDSVPNEVLAAAEERKFPDFPEISGRVSRLKDGRIGKFGWKGQVATLKDFVLTACAVELGLEVPGHHQGLLPQEPDRQPKGLDLTEKECADLTAFVRNLPRPLDRSMSDTDDAAPQREGRQIFDRIGCATCHAPNLGDVKGIYSDLLLHDMGSELNDSASYGGGFEGTPSEQLPDPEKIMAKAGSPTSTERAGKPPIAGASAKEWRTPPLWGFRDSGPYLHDGRAQNLEQAVAFHGGEAEGVGARFYRLNAKDRVRVEAFLKSLVAPFPPAGEERE